MILIADSSSTRTQWAMVEAGNIVESAVTQGLNPMFRTRREISHIIRLELPDPFFHTRLERVFVYSAGCASPERNKMVEQSVVAQFRTPAVVESDLLGAARALLGRSPGLACVISTGSNSCYYDGEKIVSNVRPCGYVLGDEGSNAYLGKRLLSDVLKGLAPGDVERFFFEMFDKTPTEIIDDVYSQPNPNLTLARYSDFLAKHIDIGYCRKMVYDSFIDFFSRNLSAYDFKTHALSVVGRTCVTYKDTFQEAAADFGLRVNKIESSSLEGLVRFHSIG